MARLGAIEWRTWATATPGWWARPATTIRAASGARTSTRPPAGWSGWSGSTGRRSSRPTTTSAATAIPTTSGRTTWRSARSIGRAIPTGIRSSSSRPGAVDPAQALRAGDPGVGSEGDGGPPGGEGSGVTLVAAGQPQPRAAGRVRGAHRAHAGPRREHHHVGGHLRCARPQVGGDPPPHHPDQRRRPVHGPGPRRLARGLVPRGLRSAHRSTRTSPRRTSSPASARPKFQPVASVPEHDQP